MIKKETLINIFSDSKVIMTKTPDRWTRFKLWFQKKEYHYYRVESVMIEYKILGGVVYILDMYTLPPNHYNCRCL